MKKLATQNSLHFKIRSSFFLRSNRARKISGALLLLLLLFSAYIIDLRAQPQGSWANIMQSGQGELSIIYYDQVGLVEKNQAGQLKGFCIDLLDQFVAFVEMKYKKKINLKYFQEEDFAKFCEFLDRQPYLLGIGNISITNERKLKYKFTPPYMPNVLRLVTHLNAPTISNSNDLHTQLQGYTAYALSSSVSEKALEKLKNSYLSAMNIRSKETALLTLEAVSKDPKGFTIIDFTEIIGAKRKNLAIKLHPVRMDKTEDLGFMMSKKSDWDIVWNEFLSEDRRSQPNYRASVAKYFGREVLTAIATNK